MAARDKIVFVSPTPENFEFLKRFDAVLASLSLRNPETMDQAEFITSQLVKKLDAISTDKDYHRVASGITYWVKFLQGFCSWAESGNSISDDNVFLVYLKQIFVDTEFDPGLRHEFESGWLIKRRVHRRYQSFAEALSSGEKRIHPISLISTGQKLHSVQDLEHGQHIYFDKIDGYHRIFSAYFTGMNSLPAINEVRLESESEKATSVGKVVQSILHEKEKITNVMTSRILRLRKKNPRQWDAVVLGDMRDNEREGFEYILVRALSRKKDFESVNQVIDEIYKRYGRIDNDCARERIRNLFVSDTLKHAQAEFSLSSYWESVEKVFQDEPSQLSYRMQAKLAKLLPSSNSNVLDDAHLLLSLLQRGTSKFKDCEISALLEVLSRSQKILVIGRGKGASTFEQEKQTSDCVIYVNHAPEHVVEGRDFICAAPHIAEIPDAGCPHFVISAARSEVYRSKMPCGNLNDYLSWYLDSVLYRRASAGLRVLTLCALAAPSSRLIAYGFDFYRDSRDSAGMSHELDFEEWFTDNALPLFFEEGRFRRLMSTP